MESKKKDIPGVDSEFSIEEVEEALKKKEGRPSNRTREIRKRLQEAQRFRDIMGILDSGILERMVDENVFRRDRRDLEGTSRIKDEPKPGSVVEELLLKSGFVNQKFIDNNKNLLDLLDQMVSNATITYGPAVIAIIGGLGGLWIAEGTIKDFPPILHTGFELTIQSLRLITVLANFISGGLGGLVDFVKDPIGTIVEDVTKPIQDGISEVLGLNRTQEEKAKDKEELLKKLRTKGGRF